MPLEFGGLWEDQTEHLFKRAGDVAVNAKRQRDRPALFNVDVNGDSIQS